MMGRSSLFVLFALVGGCANGVVDDPGVPSEGQPADDLVIVAHSGQGSFNQPSGRSENTATKGGPFFRASSDGTGDASLNTFDRDEAALQADGTLTIATKKGVPGSDPQPADYFGGSFYNGGSFRYATVVSPVWQTKDAFDRVTPSFEAFTPAGTWIEVRVTAHLVSTGAWTDWYSLGVWARDASTVRRHSVAAQADAHASVVTDTLDLASKADALQVEVTLFSADDTATPQLRAVSAIADRKTPSAVTALAPFAGERAAWGTTLSVPQQSATAELSSPTATAMLLGFWGVTSTTTEAADLSKDIVIDGTNNLPFNTAFAAAIADGQLHSMVTRLSSFTEIEPLVAHGFPVAITADHTLVVKGFTATGDVIVNDPTLDAVETTYDRTQLTSQWQSAGGATFVVWPSTVQLPHDPLGAY